MSIGKLLWRLGLALTVSLVAPSAPGSQSAMLAIVGCSVIDGNGGPPLPDAVVVVGGSRISVDGQTSNPASVRIGMASYAPVGDYPIRPKRVVVVRIKDRFEGPNFRTQGAVT